MRGSQILKEIDQLPESGKAFIRWWRPENDFADYELIADFRNKTDGFQEFGGYELLDVEEMWKRLEKLNPKRISRQKRTKGEYIVWKHRGSDGEQVEDTFSFSPESVMAIFDEETGGDTLV